MALEMITGHQTRYRSSLHPAPHSSTLNMEATGSTEKNGKGKLTPVHAVKAYIVRGDKAPLILNPSYANAEYGELPIMPANGR